MGQITKVRRSCYLVLLSTDSKTRVTRQPHFATWPMFNMMWINFHLDINVLGFRSREFTEMHSNTYSIFKCFGKKYISLKIKYDRRISNQQIYLKECDTDQVWQWKKIMASTNQCSQV